MNLSVTFVDMLVVLVLLVSAGYAAWRGFLSETLSIFAWAAAAFSTLYFGPWLVPLMRGMISSPWVASLAAYAGIFLLVFIPISFISYRFSETVKNSPIGPLDRALGIAFGVVRGLVVVGLAYLAFTYFVPIRQQPTSLTEARTLPLMQSTAEVLLSLVPNRDHDDFAMSHPVSEPVVTAKKPLRHNDALGQLIQSNGNVSQVSAGSADHPQHKSITAAQAQKGYGAQDRQALDNLLGATGSGGSGKP
jgi:membrane protein required for colicin V production